MIKIQELLSYQAPELKQRLAGMGARAETGSDSAVQASPGGGAADGGRTEGRRAGHRSRSKKLKGKVITMQAKVEGRVKWFDPIRGYGFAVRLDGGGDVFCTTADCWMHRRAWRRVLPCDRMPAAWFDYER